MLAKAARDGDVENVASLLKSEDMNQIDEDGTTALIDASSYGELDVVKLLLLSGVDVNAGTRNGTTALHVAVKYNYVTVASALLDANAIIDAVSSGADGFPATALSLACGRPDGHAVASLLLTRGAQRFFTDDTQPPIDSACDLEMLQLLLHHRPHYAHSFAAMRLLEKVVSRSDAAMVSALAAAGVRVNPTSETRHRGIGDPLLLAVERKNKTIIRTLLEAGADPMMQGDEDDLRAYPLLRAFFDEFEQFPPVPVVDGDTVFELMLEYATPEQVNRRLPDREESLLLMVVRFYTDRHRIIQKIVSAGADINRPHPETGATALFYALDNGAPAVAQLLVEACADVRHRDDDDTTTLHHLRCHSIGPESAVRLAKVLLAAGADLDAVDRLGRTPLLCCAWADKPLLLYYLERGARADACSHEGRTAFTGAAACYIDATAIERLVSVFLDQLPDSAGARVSAGAGAGVGVGGRPVEQVVDGATASPCVDTQGACAWAYKQEDSTPPRENRPRRQ
jgi:ankyrin repeat protein